MKPLTSHSENNVRNNYKKLIKLDTFGNLKHFLIIYQSTKHDGNWKLNAKHYCTKIKWYLEKNILP